jgi:TolB-like protein/tetratricopeptide (TPR) repeat protein
VTVPAQSGKVAEVQNPPVRVYTLGRFLVEVHGAPLRFGRKPQRKPLDLLKLLVAHGGKGVCAERIAEDLWPDAEGDAAATALRTTLSRARKLIGADAIRSDASGLWLDPRVCWCDALALRERLMNAVGAAAMESALEEALSLYRGEFLPGAAQPVVLTARATLRRLLLRRVVDVGSRLEYEGRIGHALALYRRGLEIDASALDIVQKLERLISGPTDSELTLAVLSFEDLNPRREHTHLAETMRETVVSLLSALPELSLVELPASAWYSMVSDRQSTGGITRYVVRGSVLVTGGRLRAGVQLVDARSRRCVWSEQLDQDLQDATDTPDRVAIAMAELLAGKLVHGEYSRTLLRPNIQVWKAITLSRALIDHHEHQDAIRARALLARVIEAEPNEPLARAQLASTHVMDYWTRWSPDPAESLRLGEQSLRRLERRHAYHGRGMHTLVWACAMRGEFSEALRRARREIEYRPDNFFNHAFEGVALLYCGRYAEALDSLNRAVRVRPQHLHWLHMTRALAQFCNGQHEEAASDLATVLVDEFPLHREANLLNARTMYVANLAAAGRVHQAREEARVILSAYPSVSARQFCRLHFHPYYRDPGLSAAIERLLVASGFPQQRTVRGAIRGYAGLPSPIARPQ